MEAEAETPTEVEMEVIEKMKMLTHTEIPSSSIESPAGVRTTRKAMLRPAEAGAAAASAAAAVAAELGTAAEAEVGAGVAVEVVEKTKMLTYAEIRPSSNASPAGVCAVGKVPLRPAEVGAEAEVEARAGVEDHRARGAADRRPA